VGHSTVTALHMHGSQLGENPFARVTKFNAQNKSKTQCVVAGGGPAKTKTMEK
jgi:hypothetical protein